MQLFILVFVLLFLGLFVMLSLPLHDDEILSADGDIASSKGSQG